MKFNLVVFFPLGERLLSLVILPAIAAVFSRRRRRGRRRSFTTQVVLKEYYSSSLLFKPYQTVRCGGIYFKKRKVFKSSLKQERKLLPACAPFRAIIRPKVGPTDSYNARSPPSRDPQWISLFLSLEIEISPWSFLFGSGRDKRA